MRGATLTVQQSQSFVVEECYSCGTLFAMTSQYRDARLGDKRTWYCPNGHAQSYVGKSDREKLAEAERRRASAEEDARIQAARAAAAAAEAERLRRRAAAAACPCCNRSFVQLARHLKSKHPEYVEQHSNSKGRK